MASLGADELCHAVADFGGFGHPACLVPARDEHFAPFFCHGFGHARRRCLGQGAERVAIQINHPVGNMEHGFGGGEVGHDMSFGAEAWYWDGTPYVVLRGGQGR